MYTFDFNYKLVVQTEETTDEDFYNDLRKFIIGEEKEITVETNGEEQEVSTVTYLRKCIN